MVSHLAFWLGAVALVLWGLRYALHRGLAPESTQAGVQPLALGLHAQAVRIPAVRGLSLFAWYVPQPGPQPAPAVVLLHGWGGNASTLLPAAQTLHQAGYAVLLPEARNHGRSDRDGHSSLPRFAQDLGSALDWLALQPGIDTTRVAALGHSVGGAAVLLAASQRTDLYGAVIVSAFAHPEQVMRRWLAARHVPYWPMGWVVNRYVERVIGARFTGHCAALHPGAGAVPGAVAPWPPGQRWCRSMMCASFGSAVAGAQVTLAGVRGHARRL
jgi:pimeloyl-ACP methyl ester carboxylesterase